MKIALHYSNNPAFVLGQHEEKGLGGTENFICYVARDLERKGHEVHVYNMVGEDTIVDNVTFQNITKFNSQEEHDLLISFRMREVFDQSPNAKVKALILADTESNGLGQQVKDGKIDKVIAVSEWQKNKIAQEEDIVDHPCWLVFSNGVDMSRFNDKGDIILNSCIHLSTPERGLDALLDIWPRIVDHIQLAGLEEFKPELHLFSSFIGWGVTLDENEQMCARAYEVAKMLADKGYQVYNHRHVNAKGIEEALKSADFMLYPSNFNETYMISLTEAMASYTIPIVSNRGALPERIEDGVDGFVVGGYESDIYQPENRDAFVEAVVKAMTMNFEERDKMRNHAHEKAKQHDYGDVVAKLVGALTE